MAVITDSIIGGIAWEIFSKGYSFYNEKIEDLTLRIYIAQQLRALEQLEGVSDHQIDEATEIIEATILETPEDIKQIKEIEEQKQQFYDYIRVKNSLDNIEDSDLDIDLGGKGTLENSVRNIKNSTIKLR
jgi:hypothetical protein